MVSTGAGAVPFVNPSPRKDLLDLLLPKLVSKPLWLAPMLFSGHQPTRWTNSKRPFGSFSAPPDGPEAAFAWRWRAGRACKLLEAFRQRRDVLVAVFSSRFSSFRDFFWLWNEARSFLSRTKNAGRKPFFRVVSEECHWDSSGREFHEKRVEMEDWRRRKEILDTHPRDVRVKSKVNFEHAANRTRRQPSSRFSLRIFARGREIRSVDLRVGRDDVATESFFSVGFSRCVVAHWDENGKRCALRLDRLDATGWTSKEGRGAGTMCTVRTTRRHRNLRKMEREDEPSARV